MATVWLQRKARGRGEPAVGGVERDHDAADPTHFGRNERSARGWGYTDKEPFVDDGRKGGRVLDTAQCQEINSAVRATFKRGYASSNKIYVTGNTADKIPVRELDRTALQNSDNEQHRTRYEQLRKSMKSRDRTIGADREGAEKLLAAAERNEIAGNCAEMATLAAHIARVNDARVRILIGNVTRPGDHVFCFVEPSMKDLTKVKSAAEVAKAMPPQNIAGFDAIEPWRGAIVIDPWLNIACEATGYVTAIKAKLQKWDERNKRILSLGHYWRPTAKAYTNGLLHLTVKYTVFAE